MKKWIFCLVVGIFCLVASTGAIGEDGVRCDGQLMSPGDVCETTTNGRVTSTETYDEVARNNAAAHETFVTWGRWALLGGGILLTGLAVWGMVSHRRRQKAAGPTTADLYFQEQQAARSGPPGAGARYPQPPYQQPGARTPQYPPPRFPAQPHMAPPQPAPPQQFTAQSHAPRPPANQRDDDFDPGSGDNVTQRLR
jgi:hypothetical protein